MNQREFLAGMTSGEKRTATEKFNSLVENDLKIPFITETSFQMDENDNGELELLTVETEKGLFYATNFKAKKGDVYVAEFEEVSVTEDGEEVLDPETGDPVIVKSKYLLVEKAFIDFFKTTKFWKKPSAEKKTGGTRVTGQNLIDAGVDAELAAAFIETFNKVAEVVKTSGARLSQYIRSKESVEAAKSKTLKSTTGTKFDATAVKP